MIKSEWRASSDPDNLTGVGIWKLPTRRIALELPMFQHFNDIENLIEKSYSQGRKDAIRDIRKAFYIFEDEIEKL